MTRSKFTSADGFSSRAGAIHANRRESHASSALNAPPNPLKTRLYKENAIHLLTKALQYPQSFRGGSHFRPRQFGGLMVRLLAIALGCVCVLGAASPVLRVDESATRVVLRDGRSAVSLAVDNSGASLPVRVGLEWL